MNEEIYGLLGLDPEKIRQQQQMQGLLSAGLNILAASGPSAQPRSLGQIIGQGGMAGLQAYEQAGEQAVQGGVQKLKIGELKDAMAERKRVREASEKFQRDIAGATRTIPTQQAFAAQQSNIEPSQLEGMSAQDVARQAMAAGMPTQSVTDSAAADRAVMDYLRVSAPAEYAKLLVKEPRALPSSIQEYQFAVGQGFKGTFADFQEQMKKAGATNINMPSGEERKAGFLANRVKFGLEQMAEVIKKNPPSASPEALPTMVKFITNSDFLSNKLTSADRQQIEAAQIDILDAALTLGTGAAYTREQLDGYRKAYFPQLGDDQATVAGKQKRLENLLQSSYISAGRAAPGAPSQTISNQPSAAPTAPAAAPAESRNQLRKLLFPQRGG